MPPSPLRETRRGRKNELQYSDATGYYEHAFAKAMAVEKDRDPVETEPVLKPMKLVVKNFEQKVLEVYYLLSLCSMKSIPMKRFLIYLFCFFSASVNAQVPSCCSVLITFEDSICKNYISIDTVNYHHNIWEIGAPHKSVFSSAYSPPNAIVTDTLNPYSANDTSVFYLKVPSWSGTIGMDSTYVGIPFQYLEFYYQLDNDSNATAKIEASIDSGASWINLRDSLPLNYSWIGSYPFHSPSLVGTPFTGIATSGWTLFQLYPETDSVSSWTYPHNTNDTIQFRFTFTSNNHYSGKDGWIIDNVFIGYGIPEGVTNIQNNNLISVYPNPSKGNIYIHSNKPTTDNASFSIFNMNGQEVYSVDKLQPNDYLNLPLPNGVYMLKYNVTNEQYQQKIIIKR